MSLTAAQALERAIERVMKENPGLKKSEAKECVYSAVSTHAVINEICDTVDYHMDKPENLFVILNEQGEIEDHFEDLECAIAGCEFIGISKFEKEKYSLKKVSLGRKTREIKRVLKKYKINEIWSSENE